MLLEKPILCLLLVFIVNICNALPREGHPLLSKYTTNQSLSNKFVKSEGLFKVGDYKNAAQVLEATLSSKNPEIKKELEKVVPMIGPLGYMTDSMRLFYLNKLYNFYNPSIEKEISKNNAKYYKQKKDNIWYAYELNLENLEEYYGRNNQITKLVNVLKTFCDYKPTDKYRIRCYLDRLIKMNSSPKPMRRALDKYKAAGGTMFPGLAKQECIIIKCENGDTLDACFAWFEKYPDANSDEIQGMLDFCRTLLDVEKPKTIEKYYLKLTNLALAQSSDPKRLAVLSAVLNERKRLEAIVPNLIPAVDTNLFIKATEK